MEHLTKLGKAFTETLIFVIHYGTMGASVVFGGLIALSIFGSFL